MLVRCLRAAIEKEQRMYIKATFVSLTVLILTVTSAHSQVVWQDEFNDTVINKDIWTYDVGGHGFGNGQFEFNTARSENSYIDNGSLVIEARDENYGDNQFTSARMLTQGRFAYKYGTLEARIKMPDTENGLWPAFWMLGNNFPGIAWPDCGEIDIVEMGSAAGIADGTQQEHINSALHYSNAAGDYEYVTQWIDASDYIATADLSADFHRYKVNWTPTDLTFYLDDVQFASWDITAPHFAEFDQPHFVIMNLAIGGYDPSYTGIYSPGAVTAAFPARMEVDWIRLEDNGYTEIYLGEDTKETGDFGVFTETTPVDSALVFGDDTAPDWPYSDKVTPYIWEETMTFGTPVTPSEGAECWTLDVGSVGWLGMGLFMPNFRNMAEYSDGFLHFDIQTTSTDVLKVGVQSSRGGQFWLPMGDETSEFGFARDGSWHTITVPLNRFANTDFKTIQQMFMLLADTATPSTTISIDNIWWEPSVVRVRPSAGNFGVYTETGGHKNSGEFALGVDGNFFVWEQTLDPAVQDPFEGSASISLQSATDPADLAWFGAAFTPNVKYDLSAYDNPNGTLSFAMKTSSSVPFKVGVKSGNMDGVGQKWISFEAGSDPYGFVRDGQWHVVEIPTADIAADVDLSQMSQLFQILGDEGKISDIELDDIYYGGGIAFETNVVAAVVQDGVGISWPSTDGSTYTVQWASALDTNTVWTSMSPDVEGDWTTKTVFDPIIDATRFYRVLETP